MKKKKKISVQTIIEVMIRAVFFIIYPALFSTAFTGIKLIVEQITQRASLQWNSFVQTLVVLHCVWTIFLWICLCIWNLGGFRLFYFIYDSQKKKKETVEMFFKSGKDTPVFKICCPACCPASLHKRLQ